MMLEAEQIEGVVSMINDMGVSVYDVAPDAETLLMTDVAPAGADEDAVEEAEAALSTVDSEFGRTTDPVRMYMREMGTVGLLTREDEIEIAKRIEEGLKHMIQAISACPDNDSRNPGVAEQRSRTTRCASTSLSTALWMSKTRTLSPLRPTKRSKKSSEQRR